MLKDQFDIYKDQITMLQKYPKNQFRNLPYLIIMALGKWDT